MGSGHGSSGLTQRVEEGKRACSRANLFGGLHQLLELLHSRRIRASSGTRCRRPPGRCSSGGPQARPHLRRRCCHRPSLLRRGRSPGASCAWLGLASRSQDPTMPFPQSDRPAGHLASGGTAQLETQVVDGLRRAGTIVGRQRAPCRHRALVSCILAVIGGLLLDRDATGDATRTEDAFAAFDILLQAHPSRVAEHARPVAVTA